MAFTYLDCRCSCASHIWRYCKCTSCNQSTIVILKLLSFSFPANLPISLSYVLMQCCKEFRCCSASHLLLASCYCNNNYCKSRIESGGKGETLATKGKTETSTSLSLKNRKHPLMKQLSCLKLRAC